MIFYLLLLAAVILLFLGGLYWIYWVIRLFQQQKIRLALGHTFLLILLSLGISWQLRIIPLAINYDFKNNSKALTGKEFWSWNDYRFEESGFRGEGFTFEIYSLEPEVATYFENPDKDFFKLYPADKFETSKWKRTPISHEDNEALNFLTPTYGNWNTRQEKTITEKQALIKKLAIAPGSYYALYFKGSTADLYLIAPKAKLFVYINHNM